MREWVSLECTVCGTRNYRTSVDAKAPDKLEVKKYCRHDRQHTVHKEKKK
jgi:large subunit ribosomal protein L33